MPLTDKQKVKIIEEEKYRASLTSDNPSGYKPKKRGFGCGTIALFTILIFMILPAAILMWLNPSKSAKKAEKQKEQQVEEVRSGIFMKYKYTIGKEVKSSRYLATFDPFLPRNDGVITAAMLELINQTYGKHKVSDLRPQIVEKGGTNVFLLQGVGVRYYFLPIKEDTGEAHSFVFWSE